MKDASRTILSYLALLMALALMATACLQEGGGGEGAGGEGATPGDGATDGGGEGAGGEGGTVTMLGAYTDEQHEFRDMLAAYAEESGITVEYEGSADFETVAVSRVEGGNPPDILLFPQPGLMADFASRDQIQPLDDVMDRADLEERLHAGLIDLGLVDDQLYGVPITINIKSLVWYPQPEFDDAGYEVPETWEDMIALTDQIRDDGVSPWCIGIESAGATGWVATDWIEDIMLRLHGPDVYDQWVAGELPFDSPEVTEAAETFAEIAFTDGNVLGGRSGILTTPFGSAPAPMFEDPPACYLHRQASFIVGSFPEEAEYGTDYHVFYLPPITDAGSYDGRPVLGAGDTASLATDNPAAAEVLQFLTTSEAFLNSRANEGGTLSAYTDVAPGDYPLEVDQVQAEILAEAEVFRFDGSDLMPGQVGAGAFWTEMVSWINEEKELPQALQDIDAAWPDE